jgi:hypothetical protein
MSKPKPVFACSAAAIQWQHDYETAWAGICEGLGELGKHVEDARAFVGDRAVLGLLKEFVPGEVIIAVSIARTDVVIGPDGRRELGAHTDHRTDRDPLMVAVVAAHDALVAAEGDTHWRRTLPPDAREQMMRYARELKAMDARGERMPWERA